MKIDKIKTIINNWFNPPKTLLDEQLEDAHLKILNLVNDQPENPYVGINSVLSGMALEKMQAINNEKRKSRVYITLMVVFLISTLYLATTVKVKPWVVGMNQNGQIFDMNSSIKDVKAPEIKNKLALNLVNDFVREVVNVSPDGDVNNRNQEAAFSVAKGSAAAFIKDYFYKNNPREIAEKYSINVQVNYTMHISANTIRVGWTKIKKNSKTNGVIFEQKYVAEITYDWDNRSGNEFIQTLNPLGFYVKAISMEKNNE